MNAREWGLLAGTLVPLIVGILARFSWSSYAKAIMAAVGSVALGVGTVYFAGGFTTTAVVTAILATYGAAQASYWFIFKPLGWTTWLLENVANTDPRKG